MKLLISKNLFLAILFLLSSQTLALKLSDVVQLRKQLKKMDQGETGLPEGRKLAELASVSLKDFEQNIQVHSKKKTKTQREPKSPKLRRRPSHFKSLRPSRKLTKGAVQPEINLTNSQKNNFVKKATQNKPVSNLAKFARRIESPKSGKIGSRKLKKLETATTRKKNIPKKAKESMKKRVSSVKKVSVDSGASKKQKSSAIETSDRKLGKKKMVKKQKKLQNKAKPQKSGVKKSKTSKLSVSKTAKAKKLSSKPTKISKTRKAASKTAKTTEKLATKKNNHYEIPASPIPETKITERKLLDMPSQNEFYEQIVNNYYPTI